jgi:Protein of unknown function (DUF3047)
MCELIKLRRVRIVVMLATLAMLVGCASLPSESASTASSQSSELAAENWVLQSLPTKKTTRFSLSRDKEKGIRVVRAQADASASLLRRKVQIEPSELSKLSFSWKVPELIASADMTVREAEDAVVRVILSFEGDRSKFSAKNRMLSDLSQALTGEEMPYATLIYVWCNRREAGSVITNPRTDRIRKLVVESGQGNLGRWLEYERDIRADFIAAFGEEPGALTGIALMTDTDNTQSKAIAWYGPVLLKNKVQPSGAPVQASHLN